MEQNVNVYKYMNQEEFNVLMTPYEKEHYSILYDIGVTLMRVLTISMLTYLVVSTF